MIIALCKEKYIFTNKKKQQQTNKETTPPPKKKKKTNPKNKQTKNPATSAVLPLKKFRTFSSPPKRFKEKYP